MKIFNFKKSVEFVANWPFWIFYIIAVGVVALIIVKIAGINIAEATKIPQDLEDELVLIPRFYNSENCFAYVDDTGRVYPKVIDVNKFTQETMETCFQESDVKYAFSLLINVPQLGALGSSYNVGPINTFNWVSRITRKEIIEDVFVVINENKYDGRLRIKVQNVE